MAKKLKSSLELALERLGAADPKGPKTSPLTAKQKAEIAETRQAAAARLAEREILFRDAIKRMADPAEVEKAESEYQIDRRRIEDDCERKLEAIRRG